MLVYVLPVGEKVLLKLSFTLSPPAGIHGKTPVSTARHQKPDDFGSGVDHAMAACSVLL